MYKETRAIVLSKIKFGDTSLVVKCMTPEKLQTFMVKGVLSKKKYSKIAYFQPLSQLKLIATDKQKEGFDYIKEIKLDVPYESIYTDYYKRCIVFFLSELLYKVFRDTDIEQRLFDFVSNSFQWLDLNNNIENFHLYFLMKLSKHMGISPNEKGIEQALYFDLINGVFCENYPKYECIQGKELLALKQIINCKKIDEIKEIKLSGDQRKEISKHLVFYYQKHLNKFQDINSLDILSSIV